MCIAQPRGASCAPTEVAIKEGVLLGTFRPPTQRQPIPHDFVLQGVVPDGISKVLVVTGQDRGFVATVKGNSFSVESDEPVRLKRLLQN